MANVVNSKMTPDDLAGAKGAEQVRARQSSGPEDESLTTHGPGYPLLHLLPSLSTQMLLIEDTARQTPQEKDLRRDVVHIATARTMAILSHMAVVVGMVLIGYRHFDNIRTGIAAATLYLLLPYTAQLTGRVDPLAESVTNSLAEANRTLAQLRGTAENVRSMLRPDAPLSHDLGQLLQQLAGTAESISTLVEFLKQHPNALITGREAPQKP